MSNNLAVLPPPKKPKTVTRKAYVWNVELNLVGKPKPRQVVACEVVYTLEGVYFFGQNNQDVVAVFSPDCVLGVTRGSPVEQGVR